jgi:hypothetical protein
MGAAAIPVVMGAFQAYSAIKQGKADQAEAKSEAEFQSKQAKADANAEMAIAEQQARKVRDIAKQQRGSARAAMAASGMTLDEGTALTIDQEIAGGAESDAQMTIFGGLDTKNRGYQAAEGAQIIGKKQSAQAKSRMVGGVLSAAGGAATGFQEKGGWKSMRETFNSKG